MSWDWRKILEVLILGQFVVEKVLHIITLRLRPTLMKLGLCHNTFSQDKLVMHNDYQKSVSMRH